MAEELKKAVEAVPLKLTTTSDTRGEAYRKIAEVHRQVVEIKWRARTAGAPVHVDPSLILHCEESLAFLAEEMLKLWKLAESIVPKLEDVKKILEADEPT